MYTRLTQDIVDTVEALTPDPLDCAVREHAYAGGQW
jgi:hypothetical protein